MASALVIGSGPNGLAAAITLAEAGVDVHVVEAADEVGGGTRSSHATLSGLTHDVCSAVHPFAAASPFFNSQPLAEHGLKWAYPEVMVAHPLDDGTAAALSQSLDVTAKGLGAGGDSWRKIMSPLVRRFDHLVKDVLKPPIGLPAHPATFARFGVQAALPATVLAKRLGTPSVQALFAGNAAHLCQRLDRPLASSVGLMLSAAAHAVGWPVAVGGSGAIAQALEARLLQLGGTVETGRRVETVDDTAGFDLVFFNLAPTGVVKIGASRLASPMQKALEGWKHGPAAFKLDIAIEGDIPWTASECAEAGTVHLGGTLEEVAEAERMVQAGTMPKRPFVLVGQQYLADPSRSTANANPLWIYGHVPHGYTGDATESILDQVERFAPGFRDRILHITTTTPADLARYNANYVGGDILTGANSLLQMIRRPTVRPYSLGVDGWFLCSAATSPGAGVHGMAGFHAARAALRQLQP